MTVDPARAAGQFEHDGTTYYFCSKGCLAKFAADPQKYLSGTRPPPQATPASARQAPVIPVSSLKAPIAPPHSAPSQQPSRAAPASARQAAKAVTPKLEGEDV